MGKPKAHEYKEWVDLTPEERSKAPWWVKPRYLMSEDERRTYHAMGFNKRKGYFKHSGDRKYRWVWNEMTEEWLLEVTDCPYRVFGEVDRCSVNPYLV